MVGLIFGTSLIGRTFLDGILAVVVAVMQPLMLWYVILDGSWASDAVAVPTGLDKFCDAVGAAAADEGDSTGACWE